MERDVRGECYKRRKTDSRHVVSGEKVTEGRRVRRGRETERR